MGRVPNYELISLYKAPTNIGTDLGLGFYIPRSNFKDLLSTPGIGTPFSAAELIHVIHTLHLSHLGARYELCQVSLPSLSG